MWDTDGPQTNEKMLNITSHQGNVSQSHNEMPPHTSENDWYQKTKKWQVLEVPSETVM